MLKLGEINQRDDSKLDIAQAIIEKAIDLNPNLAEAHISLGRIFEKKGRNDEALELFKKGLKLT